jgi:hypothetical protein
MTREQEHEILGFMAKYLREKGHKARLQQTKARQPKSHISIRLYPIRCRILIDSSDDMVFGTLADIKWSKNGNHGDWWVHTIVSCSDFANPEFNLFAITDRICEALDHLNELKGILSRPLRSHMAKNKLDEVLGES